MTEPAAKLRSESAAREAGIAAQRPTERAARFATDDGARAAGVATQQPDGRLHRLWRVFGTGVSFASFGLGGVLLWLLVFPSLHLLVRDPARKGVLARHLIARTFRYFIAWMRVLGVLSYRIEGVQRLQRRGLLVLANHPTLIDVVFLISLIPDADCVVKSRLLRNPFTRGPIRATGYICNDSGPGLVDDCIVSLRSGKNLLIFPEGTRSPPGGFGVLQRGAANIAVRGGRDITPVLIQCTPPTLTKGLPWYRVPERRFHVSIRVLPDILVAPFPIEPGLSGPSLIESARPETSSPESTEPMAARRLTAYLSNFFQTELHRAGT